MPNGNPAQSASFLSLPDSNFRLNSFSREGNDRTTSEVPVTNGSSVLAPSGEGTQIYEGLQSTHLTNGCLSHQIYTLLFAFGILECGDVRHLRADETGLDESPDATRLSILTKTRLLSI